MAQDIKKMFENDNKIKTKQMPQGHEARFLQKLETGFPAKSVKNRFGIYHVAASVVVLLGLSFGAYQFFKNPVSDDAMITPQNEVATIKSLGDI